jgi:hypothetical protein
MIHIQIPNPPATTTKVLFLSAAKKKDKTDVINSRNTIG